MNKEKKALELLQGNTKKKSNPLGWSTIPLDKLGYKGKYYPANTTIEISKMSVKTLKWISSVDMKNPVELNRVFNYIVEKHCRVKVGSMTVDGSHVFAFDRTFLLFSIRELNNFNSPISFEAKCTECKHTNVVPLSKNINDFKDNNIDKYWNGLEFSICPEGFENIYNYMPPTINEVNKASELSIKLVKEQNQDIEIVSAFLKYFAFLRTPVKEEKGNTIKDYYTAFVKLRDDQIEELDFLVENSIETKETTEIDCTKCASRFQSNIQTTDFENFTKSERKFVI
jgi:hypothetical protein